MGKTKVMVTQNALNVLKQNYKIIKVDGLFVGICPNNKLSELKNLKKSEILKKIREKHNWVRFYTKYQMPGITRCAYNAKNPNKVHNGSTTMYMGDADNYDGIVRNIPDERIVWMTEAEGKKFDQEAKKHQKLFPGYHTCVDPSSDEMRRVIPRGKDIIFELEGNSISEIVELSKIEPKRLMELGIPVCELNSAQK